MGCGFDRTLLFYLDVPQTPAWKMVMVNSTIFHIERYEKCLRRRMERLPALP